MKESPSELDLEAVAIGVLIKDRWGYKTTRVAFYDGIYWVWTEPFEHPSFRLRKTKAGHWIISQRNGMKEPACFPKKNRMSKAEAAKMAKAAKSGKCLLCGGKAIHGKGWCSTCKSEFINAWNSTDHPPDSCA